MNLIDAIVNNPVKVAVGVLLVMLFGVIAMFRMPMQLTPEVETPTITITTNWPGASPQEVEQEIVIEQEEQLKGVEGARKMSSESTDSQGRITIEFNVGTDIDQALLKINSRLQQVPEYPIDADQPVLTTSDPGARAIAWFILSPLPPSDEQVREFIADHPSSQKALEPVLKTDNVGLKLLRLRQAIASYPPAQALSPKQAGNVPKLKRFVEDEIEARFERVEGVSQSNVMGGLEDELQVIVDPEKLAARHLTLGQVRDVLQAENRDTSAGQVDEGKRRNVVRVLNQFRSPEQVENQLLAMREGLPVFVRDVAEVKLGFKKPDGLVRRFGESCIAVNCERETGANVIDIMAGLREVTAELNRDILSSQGLLLSQVYDETDYINSSVNLVQQNIILGGALTMIVLMLFLHFGFRALVAVPMILITALAAMFLTPLWFILTIALVIGSGFWFARGALVIGLAIPASIVGTFLILGMLGRSLNVISLAGLAFAVGMLVDNAVVVLENIFRYYSLGDRPMRAAAKGTQEVWGAVLSSTLTTIAVFLPIVFVEEEAGQLFRDIALAISAAVGLSLLVSITVIPTAAARLFRDQRQSDAKAPSQNGRSNNSAGEKIALEDGWFGRKVTGTFVAINAWVQGGILRQALTIVVLVTGSAVLSWLMWPKVEYLPSGNRNLIMGIVIPPPGYNIDQLMGLGAEVEEDLRPYWDNDSDVDIDQLDRPAIEDFFFVVRGRSVFMGVRSRDTLRSAALVPVLQDALNKLPGTMAIAKQTSLFERGLTAGRTIDIEITGPRVEHLVALGRRMYAPKKMGGFDIMNLYPGTRAVAQPSLNLSSPEVHVEPKLVQAADMQFSASELGFAVNALIDGAYVGDYFLQGKKIDLTVIGHPSQTERTHLIQTVPVATPGGELVPLSALADVRLSSGPEQINHRERVRSITVQVTPPANVALEDGMEKITSEIITPLREGGDLEGGYRIALSGTADKLSATWNSVRFNVGLALIITYLLMAALFESWLYPLVIILTVPLGAVGGLGALWLLNLFVLQPLDVLTMLGFVVLIGTVVNNPILIVHQSLNHIRFDGMSTSAAILESVRNRTRPIFMTTVTTLLGLSPLVFFPGAGSELYRGLGAVVLGGLVVSTLFTLILVPTLLRLTFAVFKPDRQDANPESTEAEMDELFHAPPARLPAEQLARSGGVEN